MFGKKAVLLWKNILQFEIATLVILGVDICDSNWKEMLIIQQIQFKKKNESRIFFISKYIVIVSSYFFVCSSIESVFADVKENLRFLCVILNRRSALWRLENF